MACGLPIVATKVGGVPEAVEGCGILVKPKKPEEIANAVIRLIENKRMRIKLGKFALQKFRKNFTTEKMVEQYMKLYKSSLESPANAP